MRSKTRMTTALGITLGLALIGIPQFAAAQAGAAIQDQGLREESGYSAFPESRAAVRDAYAQETNKPQRASTDKRARVAASKPKHEPAATQARAASQEPANFGANGSSLPGYAARPQGMCWIREFGSGHDLTGGYWAACPQTH